MFFVGFFVSPLPYLLLLGIYMSGYAFFSLKADTLVEEETESENRIAIVDVHESTQVTGSIVQWPSADNAGFVDEEAIYSDNHKNSPPGVFPAYFLSRVSLFSLTIRPPPVI